MRSFWKGEGGLAAELGYRLSGSSDLYQSNGRRPYASINLVTAHDGFTLRDLVSYNHKHNEANGENNQDGHNDNRSWNYGVEGPTDDPEINALRARQQRNFLATLLLSQGTPMIGGGDEIGRTQHYPLEALTHRSWLKEQRDQGLNLGDADQQRLEFLGDAFLGYVVGRALFEADREADEGALTDRRKRLVEGKWLNAVGERLEVQKVVRLGKGEEAFQRRNERLCKDTVEALIGAILLDGGDEPARALIHRLMTDSDAPSEAGPDPIIAFGEEFQKRFRSPPPEPEYTSTGEDHMPMWQATLERWNGTTVRGTGTGKKDAKREAYRNALASIHQHAGD